MPNRIIKDSIRTSKTVNGMTDFQFRLWVYLITYVDDYGRGSADPELLKGFVFPRRKGITESTIEKALLDLANSGSVLLYEVDGEPYFCFPNWSDHQRIQTKKSKFPAPDDGSPRLSTVTHGDSPPESESNPNTNPNPNTKEACARFTPPTVDEVRSYCHERKNSVDPQHFVDYYEARGWMLGKVKMKDWRSAVRTWEKKSPEFGQRASKNVAPACDRDQNRIDHKAIDDMERMRRMMAQMREDEN